jgi:hypothetical protein
MKGFFSEYTVFTESLTSFIGVSIKDFPPWMVVNKKRGLFLRHICLNFTKIKTLFVCSKNPGSVVRYAAVVRYRRNGRIKEAVVS